METETFVLAMPFYNFYLFNVTKFEEKVLTFVTNKTCYKEKYMKKKCKILFGVVYRCSSDIPLR